MPLVRKIEEKGLTRQLIYDGISKTFYHDNNVNLEDRSGEVNLYRYNKDGRTNEGGIESGKQTIVVIHGLNGHSEGPNIKKLLTTAAEKYEKDYQVLALDWKPLAEDGVPPWKAARAIKPVAEWGKNTLENLGIKAEQITLFGHSLGSYVSAEIAAGLFSSGYVDGGRLGLIPTGQKQSSVNHLVALDPAYPGAEYDVDGNAPGFQGITKFKDVTDRSLAFVVADSGKIDGVSGDNVVAGNNADESLVIRYNFALDRAKPGERHSRVIDVFADILSNNHLKLSDDLALPSDLKPNKYLDNGRRYISLNLDPTVSDVARHEGVIVANRDGTVKELWYDNGSILEKKIWT
ncbi:MAG: alpha/beta fold hydrolase [Okeania sp. SIO2H7]|nr:alpha/beta fold hydrolase [Okeania sp. SIO2H7]